MKIRTLYLTKIFQNFFLKHQVVNKLKINYIIFIIIYYNKKLINLYKIKNTCFIKRYFISKKCEMKVRIFLKSYQNSII